LSEWGAIAIRKLTKPSCAGWILTRPGKRLLASDVTASVRSCRGIGTKELGELLDPLVPGGWLEPETPFPNNRAPARLARLRTAWRFRSPATSFDQRARSSGSSFDERGTQKNVRCGTTPPRNPYY
jgi:hypothetical protein